MPRYCTFEMLRNLICDARAWPVIFIGSRKIGEIRHLHFFGIALISTASAIVRLRHLKIGRLAASNANALGKSELLIAILVRLICMSCRACSVS